jgi:hypothetical protein
LGWERKRLFLTVVKDGAPVFDSAERGSMSSIRIAVLSALLAIGVTVGATAQTPSAHGAMLTARSETHVYSSKRNDYLD